MQNNAEYKGCIVYSPLTDKSGYVLFHRIPLILTTDLV